jgi:multidrug efflux system outer membrane protein
MKTKLLSLAMIPILSACSVGADFSRPQTITNTLSLFQNEPLERVERTQYTSELEGQDDAQPHDTSFKTQPMRTWWRRIDDPHIADHIDMLLSQNLDLKAAGARILQARARTGIARGDYLPSISANGSGSRSFTTNEQTSNRVYTSNYAAELETSWELDLFGRVRRSAESTDANFRAAIYDHEALAHALIAELFNRRVAISVNGRLLDLAQQNADNRRKIYDLIKARYDMGARNVQAEDVFLAKENVTTLDADVQSAQRRLTDELYAFDVLMGQAPGTTSSYTQSFPVLPAPLDIAVCVPANLLDRRPDLRAAEQRFRAANADIGVAIADLYPRVTLGGAIGFSGDEPENLFSVDHLLGSLIASLTNRLFEGGSLRANIDLQEAEAEELIHSYAALVLEAVREVESALQAEEHLAEEVLLLRESVVALTNAEDISEQRYLKGVLSLQDLLNTQQRRYQIEQSAILREQDKWATRIALYLALGGDWVASAIQNKDDIQKEEGECQ